MRIFILLLLTSLTSVNSHATNYYLSNTGDDSNDGKSKEKPWRTLKKIIDFNHVAQPGDSIFLERGSLFNGQLDISCSGLYLGAYGFGSKPIISGSLELVNWTLLKGNIWRTECRDCSFETGNIFIDGKHQIPGRYPNQGYLSLSGYDPAAISIKDDAHIFSDTYWSSAELVVRSSRWTIDRLSVTEYRGKTFYAHDKPSYNLQPGFGYFIQNHLSTLDCQGEWYFDPKAKQLFIFLKDNFTPSRHTIEATIFDFGLTAKSANDLVIENIFFDKQNKAALKLRNCNNVQVSNLEVANSGKNGIEILSGRNPIIKNSIIRDVNNNGIELHDNSGGSLSHNTILRIGLKAGLGGSGNGTHLAIYLTSSENTPPQTSIEYNTIDSIGYSAIDFRTGNTCIAHNSISNFCLLKDDGAGVYTWGNSKAKNIIEANTIRDGIGNGDGTMNGDELYASGIYIDDLSSGILIKNNSISSCSMAGVFIHNSSDLKLKENILQGNGSCMFNKEKGQLYIKLDNIGKSKLKQNLAIEVNQNKFTATNENEFCLFVSTLQKEELHRIGSFNQNQYTACYPDQAVAIFYNQDVICSSPEKFTLNEWSKSSLDGSNSSFKISSSKMKFFNQGEELIHQKNDNSPAKGWQSWPEKSIIENEGKSPVHILKVNVPDEIKEALLYHAGIYFNKKKLYRLSFSAKSVQSSKIEFVPLMASSPWTAIGKYACFSVSKDYKTFTYYFTCEKNDIEARVNFKSNSSFWVKGVTLYEVTENSMLTAK